MSVLAAAVCVKSKSIIHHNQFVQIERFLMYLTSIFITEVAQIFGDFLGYFEKHCFLSKRCCGYFLGYFWKILATF